MIAVGVGWVVAMLCAFAPRQTLPFRVMIFSAFGVSEAVTGYMWITMLRPDSGRTGQQRHPPVRLSRFRPAWLGDPNTAIWALIIAASWGAAGLPLILCFASMQAIPRNVLEAAYIDGARPISIMRHIIAPLSMPGVRVAIVHQPAQRLRAFDTIYVLTGGGPVRTTETIGFFMFRELSPSSSSATAPRRP